MSALAPLLFAVAATPSAPTELPSLRAAFLAGDLVTLARGRQLLAEAGADVEVGSLGLLDDLSRLVRCLPLGPLPTREAEIYAAARRLVRLERIRLEQLGRDGLHARTALAALLGPQNLYATRAARQSATLVRWPAETELWPGEVSDPRPERRVCPTSAGAARESPAPRHAERRALRQRAEREALAHLVPDLRHLPPGAGAAVALAYLDDAAEAPESFAIPDRWLTTLEQALVRAAGPERSAGLVLLGRQRERAEDLQNAERLYTEALGIPERTDAEDSRVRVRLVGLLEPRWEAVLAVAKGARAPRPEDRGPLQNAEARALHAMGRTGELMTFGRRFVLREDRPGPFDAQTADLLLALGLVLEPAEAMAWLEEIGPRDREQRAARFSELAARARDEGRLPLAVAIYDRLRVEAAARRAQIGPRAAAEEVKWLAERARVEYARGDPAAFAGLIDELLAMATADADRPLARHAPHREIARLTQALLGRLTNDVPGDPERRKFAALLLEATTRLSATPTRYRTVLEGHHAALRALAGPYAVGRDGRAPAGARARIQKAPEVRQLGEVVVPRLPPRLDAPDAKTPLPAVHTFLIYEAPDGAWIQGAPWAGLAPKKR